MQSSRKDGRKQSESTIFSKVKNTSFFRMYAYVLVFFFLQFSLFYLEVTGVPGFMYNKRSDLTPAQHIFSYYLTSFHFFFFYSYILLFTDKWKESV